MSENKIYSQKDQYGFYYDDYYNKEFDEYGFNAAGIFLKRGYSYYRGGHDIDNYHKYKRFCDIKKYPDYIIVSLAYFASDTVNNSMLRYGWKYSSEQKIWINKTDNVNFEKFVKFLQHSPLLCE